MRIRVVGCEFDESWMEAMALDVEVRASACEMSCLSFACDIGSVHLAST